MSGNVNVSEERITRLENGLRDDIQNVQKTLSARIDNEILPRLARIDHLDTRIDESALKIARLQADAEVWRGAATIVMSLRDKYLEARGWQKWGERLVTAAVSIITALIIAYLSGCIDDSRLAQTGGGEIPALTVATPTEVVTPTPSATPTMVTPNPVIEITPLGGVPTCPIEIRAQKIKSLTYIYRGTRSQNVRVRPCEHWRCTVTGSLRAPAEINVYWKFEEAPGRVWWSIQPDCRGGWIAAWLGSYRGID